MKYLAFGEIMLRLKSVGQERLFQSPMLEATFGGSEANAAISMANYGLDVGFLSALPQNAVGQACAGELRRFGVDTSRILWKEGRMGVYYMEPGANQLPARVIYDRADSAMALTGPGEIDWDQAFQGVSWFHITGITPGISRQALELTLEGTRTARRKGITVSCDYNYRDALWKYGCSAETAMRELTGSVNVLLASEFDMMRTFGLPKPDSERPEERCRILGDQLMERCPDLHTVASTLREIHSADCNGWSACLNCRGTFYTSKKYEIGHIVDRIGAGDAFAGALVYGLEHYGPGQQALEFATAAACLKHSIVGDYNRLSAQAVEALAFGGSDGRISR